MESLLSTQGRVQTTGVNTSNARGFAHAILIVRNLNLLSSIYALQ